MAIQLLRQRRSLRGIATVLVLCFFLYGFYAVFSTSLPERGTQAQSSTPRSALVSLVKQRDMNNIIDTVRNVEDRYNHRFKHDWVFLSEEEFKAEFITAVSAFVSGEAHFRTINRKAHWTMPSNIDRNKLVNDMRNLDIQGVPYGGSKTYRLMARFQSMAFVEYLPEYRYYARIDPDIKFYCDVEEDLFAVMHESSKKYGFAISLQEVPHAAHDFSKSINGFMKSNQDILHSNQWLDSFVQPWDSFCHFWSNFEVADLDFFRSEQYKKLFEYIDLTGGFFYNRWGDALVHTTAVSLFLDPSEVHWFRNVGMYHQPNMNCPPSVEDRLKHKCTCPHDSSLGLGKESIFTYKRQSCVPQFLNLTREPFQNGWRDYADVTVADKFESK